MDVLARDQSSSSAKLDECLIRYRSQTGSIREQTAEELSRLIVPILLKNARNRMRSGSHGRDFCSADDLAQAVWVKIFENDEILADYRVGEGITTYLARIVLNIFKDDLRRLNGRDKSVPRVYVHDTAVLENEESKRRSQSAYAQLRQTKEILRRYLRQLPGKVVEVPVKVRGDNPSKKRVILTDKHADLLKAWMDPENEDASWDELAESIGKPVGTIKRWFSEVTVHLCTDPDSDADSLRKDYGIKEPFRSNGDE